MAHITTDATIVQDLRASLAQRTNGANGLSLLKPATVEQAAAKVGIFGSQGSGKTTTAMLFLIGLSKTYHENRAIAFLDTENGSDYLIPICQAEGVPLFVVKSRAFKDMRAALAEAEQAGCCGFLVDSYTHPWQELCDSFKAKSKRNRLEFHHMDELKRLWRGWTDQFLNSPLHVIVNGRLGYEWGEEKDDDGNKTLVKLGSKMKSETEAGYEPSLLIEMEGFRPVEAPRSRKRGAILHRAHVLKDRWRSLNGRTFEWPDINDYKPGGYRKAFGDFAPHWNQLALAKGVQRAVDAERSSVELFDTNGQTVQQKRLTRVQIVCEEIQATLGTTLWPGQDAKSKAMKLAAIQSLFGTRSWTAVENKPLEVLEGGLTVLQTLEAGIKAGTTVIDEPADLILQVQTIRDQAVL